MDKAPKGRAIVLLSDGTGNSASALFKTNVWRLYQALDPGVPNGQWEQIACYNDGVGTSTFRPLALLGGAFGVGLRRNVLQLYEFLCREWREGDRIYLFGFSRGAFTVRVLAGLIVTQGIVQADDANLRLAVRDAYRNNRRRYKTTGGMVEPLRWLRDAFVAIKRKVFQQQPYMALDHKSAPGETRISFIGVWDTVAAYGTPVAELTRGVDDWVWPLSMPNYRLSPQVECARHALALDDERDAFHPLLWDERPEADLVSDRKTTEGRLLQVWFAGMHADVGGGYPDDALAHVPLQWMMGEADRAGLRFRPAAIAEINGKISRSAPLHDSRRGLGGYYRYQPRRIAAWLTKPDKSSLIMRDPRTKKDGACLEKVIVHESVFERIKFGPDHYAPLAIPLRYEVLGGPPVESADQQSARIASLEAARDAVWKRRINYFMIVGVSFVLALMPLLEGWLWTETACQGAVCLLSPLLLSIGNLLPAFVAPWIEAYARSPFVFLGLAVALWLLNVRSSGLQKQIHHLARAGWAHVHGAKMESMGASWVYHLRTNIPYQVTLRFLKWRAVPAVFGMFLFLIAVLLPLYVLRVPSIIADEEQKGELCVSLSEPPQDQPFDTREMCWKVPKTFTKGTKYRMTLNVEDPWLDLSIATDPLGFSTARMGPKGLLALPLRRSPEGRWFQPHLTIVSADNQPRVTQALDFQWAGSAYVADFEAAGSGDAFMWVNDAVGLDAIDLATGAIGTSAAKNRYYINNKGTAKVTLTEIAPAQAKDLRASVEARR